MDPKDGYISYIVNPKSGASSGKVLVGQFKDYLVEAGFDVRPSFTESLEHACELATKAAVDYDCGLVVAAGGDGTVREIAHGLEGSDKPMLLVPGGTENLLGNELGFDDKIETLAIKTVFGERAKDIPISSTKSMVGHLLGASGSVELIATLLTIIHGKIHPTANYETPDPECDLNYTPNKPIDKTVNYAISNSFGFGGHNVSLAVKKYKI